MTIFLIVLLLIAVGIIIQQYRYRRRLIKGATEVHNGLMANISSLTDALAQARQNYHALEIGMDEQVDNYENQFLTFKEQIRGLENTVEYQKGAREEVERLLELKEFVILRHAEGCDTMLTEVVADMIEYLKPGNLVHNHASTEKCDENACTTDRYVDGTHVFTDKTVESTPADG